MPLVFRGKRARRPPVDHRSANAHSPFPTGRTWPGVARKNLPFLSYIVLVMNPCGPVILGLFRRPPESTRLRMANQSPRATKREKGYLPGFGYEAARAVSSRVRG